MSLIVTDPSRYVPATKPLVAGKFGKFTLSYFTKVP